MDDPEILEQPGRPRPDWWPSTGGPPWLPSRLVVGRVVVGLVALGLVGWGGDQILRSREGARVADCAGAAEHSSSVAASKLTNMSDYIAPALYALPDGPRRDGLYVLVADAAGEALPQVQRSLDRCREAGVLPIHQELRHRRVAYVEYLEAEVERLAAVREDGSAYYRDTPELTSMRARLFTR